jgi:hypothetical protein
MRNWTSTLAWAALGALLSCGPKQGPLTDVPLTSSHGPAAHDPEAAADEGPPLSTFHGELFSGAGVCQECHDDIQGDAGQDVSIAKSWRAGMMANASRDPYWLATVSAEVAAAPALASVIEDKCASCHMPMARFTDAAKGGKGTVFEGYAQRDHALHELADDGVSCTVCHQIAPDGLGSKEQSSGKIPFDSTRAKGDRVIYGLREVPPADAAKMVEQTGYRPVVGAHMGKSEMCATCHTLFTPYVDNAGKIAGELPEQTPYQEWQKSGWSATHQCQDCHMPPTSRNGRRFYQHQFSGGNVWMLKILQASAEELGVKASAAQLDLAIMWTQGQLEMATAELSLDRAALAAGTLSASVTVKPRTGHKLPTAFPSRRVWLHVLVADGAGKVLFESGKAASSGAIAGNANDADPTAFEPHYATVRAADEVQIYESIMVDVDDAVTTRLLRGARYVKDNRLLPRALEPQELDPDIAIYGAAAADPDFRAGADTVGYEIDVRGAAGPLTFTAELLYQSVGFRWRENLRTTDTEPVRTFFRVSDKVPNTPVVLARVSQLVK